MLNDNKQTSASAQPSRRFRLRTPKLPRTIKVGSPNKPSQIANLPLAGGKAADSADFADDPAVVTVTVTVVAVDPLSVTVLGETLHVD